MEEQDDFFSPDHELLLNIATWAKYLAWVALIGTVVYVGLAIILNYLIELHQAKLMAGASQDANEILSLLKGNPNYLVDVISDALNGLLKGIIYFLVLKSISLGLNMIVETDINYREKKATEENNE